MSADSHTLERLSDSVAKIRELLSNEQIEEFTSMLEGVDFTRPALDDMDILDLSPSQRDRLKLYLKKIREGEELMAVALSLSETSKSDINTHLEICWTGPTDNPYIRMTWPALSEIILEAKESILIVGYTITTKMRKVMDHLEEKSRDNVKLVFMIDRVDEKEDFLQWVKRLYPLPEIYTRPQNPVDPFSALHVKCVVVDEKVVMFGSANLTYYGMKGNIELGLIVKDENTVKKIVHLLQELRKKLVKINLADI